jgi:4-hydroxy-2-oxoheptanedioate aldolase
MYRENSLKERLGRGHVAYGMINAMGSSVAAEMIGMAGYDYVIVDGEHGLGDLQCHLGALQAIGSTPATALYRIANNDRTVLKQVLDLGVEGVIVPCVSTATEAQAAVAACRYPTKGVRGFAAGMVRASNYGLSLERYLSDGPAQLLISVMIETVEGVKNAAEIASVEGVDVVQMGPADLSFDLGVAGRLDDPRYVAAQRAVEEAANREGKVLGGAVMPGISLDYLLERGYRMITMGADVVCLSRALSATLATARR